MSDHLYHCVNKKCRQYKKQRSLTMAPSEAKQATGRAVRCGSCGDALVYDGEQGKLFEKAAVVASIDKLGNLPTSETETMRPKTLEERVAQIERQMAELKTALEHNGCERHMPEQCQQHKCSYYLHYLAYGPAELTHEGFHAAEQHCTEVQLRAQKWMDEHPTSQLPQALEALCRAWEVRVRA